MGNYSISQGLLKYCTSIKVHNDNSILLLCFSRRIVPNQLFINTIQSSPITLHFYCATNAKSTYLEKISVESQSNESVKVGKSGRAKRSHLYNPFCKESNII